MLFGIIITSATAVFFWMGSLSYTIEVQGLEGLLFNPSSSSNYVSQTPTGSLNSEYSVYKWNTTWELQVETRQSVGLTVIDAYQAEVNYIEISIMGIPEGAIPLISYNVGAFTSMLGEDRLFLIENGETSIPLDTQVPIDGSKIIFTDILVFAEGESILSYANLAIIHFEFDTSACPEWGAFQTDITIKLGA